MSRNAATTWSQERPDGYCASSRPILTFVGADPFTATEDVRARVVAASYLNLLVDGAHFWEQRHPGFLDEFHASTQIPTDTVVALRRWTSRANTVELRLIAGRPKSKRPSNGKWAMWTTDCAFPQRP